MTGSNIIEALKHNGHRVHEKTPEEIQLEIARTRSAITEDLLALSERLSPEHLRESARDMMRDAREEAKGLLQDAKQVAVDSLRGAKDRALGSVQDTVSAIGGRARDASAITADFVSSHAVAISLLTAGAGWLVWLLRSSRGVEDEYAYRYEHYAVPPSEPRDRLRSVSTRASKAVDAAREQVRSAAHRLDHARERAGAGLHGAARRTRELANDNRLAVVGLTLAAGLGIGMLLPVRSGRRDARERTRAAERAARRVYDLSEFDHIAYGSPY